MRLLVLSTLFFLSGTTLLFAQIQPGGQNCECKSASGPATDHVWCTGNCGSADIEYNCVSCCNAGSCSKQDQ